MMGRQYWAITSIVLLVLACKNNSKEIQTNSFQKKDSMKVGAVIKFPDTVYRNEVNRCTITYKGHFDTITTSFEDRYKRYIYVYFHNSKNVYSDAEFERLPHDTIGADNNRTITIPGFKFSKLGTYYIDGIIQDMVFVDLPNRKGEEKTRYLENKWRVTRKVVVIESSKENFKG